MVSVPLPVVRSEETGARTKAPGSDGSPVVVEALCGVPAHLDGELDIAVICERCNHRGREAGGDPGEWVAKATVRVELRVVA